MNNKIVLLLASDDTARARALLDALYGLTDTAWELQTELCDLLHAPQCASSLQPDIVLLDRGAVIRTWSAIERLARAGGRTRCLMLCDAASPPFVAQAVRAGVAGYVSWDMDPALLAKALRVVHGGESWYGRAALHETLLQLVGADPRSHLRREQGKLTSREEQILELIGSGLSNKEIARRLDISDKTVKTHLHRVHVKLNRSGRYKALLVQPRAQDLRWATLDRITGLAASPAPAAPSNPAAAT